MNDKAIHKRSHVRNADPGRTTRDEPSAALRPYPQVGSGEVFASPRT